MGHLAALRSPLLPFRSYELLGRFIDLQGFDASSYQFPSHTPLSLPLASLSGWISSLMRLVGLWRWKLLFSSRMASLSTLLALPQQSFVA